ncbi:MAG: hypothetical protein LCI00_23420 [Chloroflexi bacterium]|nr:hypothetical protein [Chloroflexota bacterium]
MLWAVICGGLVGISVLVGRGLPPEREMLFSTSFDLSDLNIYRLNLSRQILRPLTRSLADNPINDFLPEWSPDGQSIVYVSDRDGSYSVYLADAQGSSTRPMTGDSDNEYAPAWSPDGQSIVYVKEQDGYPQLMLYNVAANTTEQLTDSYRTHVSPVWSPDGASITFVSDLDERWNTKIYSLDMATRVITPLRVGSATDPAWSPDGRYLLYIGGIEKVNFYLWDSTTEQSALLYEGQFLTNDTPDWSADSASIIYAAFINGSDTTIYQLNIAECLAQPAACTPHPLTYRTGFYRTPRWRPE